jgi:drug/metabolite transporter (DMT)-like permease
MIYLFLASLLWAFSFGLIGQTLVGVDSSSVTLVRLLLALGVFLPFLVTGVRRLGVLLSLKLMVVGCFQFGVMYLAYMGSYRYLKGHQVALMTTFTPLLVMLFHGLPRGLLRVQWLVACACAIVGAVVVMKTGGAGTWREAGTAAWLGVALIQLSNVCFAAGQVAYRRLMGHGRRHSDHGALAIMYLGAVLIALVWAMPRGFPGALAGLSVKQWLALVYLGLIPSGLGFYLWNRGARVAKAGGMAIMNNLKVPLAVLLSLVLFREKASYGRVLISMVLFAVALALVSWPLSSRQRS